jgi:aspartyl-tRNA(Asn)/glutamyl-tRNA(Gln) amidotransferase subunit A
MVRSEDAHTLIDAYRTGRADPIEEVERCLAIASDLPACFITLTAARARSEAAAASRRWRRGEPLSALDGIPISWKDLFDVRGTPTTMGTEIYRHAMPAEDDAATVSSASKAGLVAIGKTNLTELAFSGLGLNPHHGTPTNPALEGGLRVPGGSSSGAAVAVAAGASLLGMATDTAGSARIPAAFNGLVGFRASTNRISFQGVRPLAPTLDALGAIAKSVRDLASLDNILTDRRGAADRRGDAPDSLQVIVDELVIGEASITQSVRDDVSEAIGRLRHAGVSITSRPVTAFHAVLDLIGRHGWLGASEAFALHESLLGSADADRLDQRVRRRLERAREMAPSDIVALYRARSRLMSQMAEELGQAILITPTVAHPAPFLAPLEADPELFAMVNLATLRLTMPGSFLDMPSISLPVGEGRAGNWTGLQLSLPSGQDDRLLRSAATIEAMLRGS